MKKYAFILSLIILLQSMPAYAGITGGVYWKHEQPVSPAYSDWAEKYINKAENWGFLTRGMQGGYTEYISRQLFCEIAYNMLIKWGVNDNVSGASVFSDTDSQAVNALYALGIVNGRNTSEFAPNDSITREEAATMLTRLTLLMNISARAYNHKFDDEDQISGWAKDAVYKICSCGIMNGTAEYVFSPKGKYTKEQAVATIVRLYEAAS